MRMGVLEDGSKSSGGGRYDMLGYGLLGTIVVVILVVWLVRAVL